jgi:hypothetical protein
MISHWSPSPFSSTDCDRLVRQLPLSGLFRPEEGLTEAHVEGLTEEGQVVGRSPVILQLQQTISEGDGIGLVGSGFEVSMGHLDGGGRFAEKVVLFHW